MKQCTSCKHFDPPDRHHEKCGCAVVDDAITDADGHDIEAQAQHNFEPLGDLLKAFAFKLSELNNCPVFCQKSIFD